MIKLKNLLSEITFNNVTPYMTRFVWDEIASSRNAIEYVECTVPCDGIPIKFNFDKQWGHEDESNWSFSIISPSTDPNTERRNWTISHSRSDATGKVSYMRLMRTVLEAILDFVHTYAPTSIDVTGSDNAADKDLQKTRIYRALLDANAAELATSGYTVLDASGKLYIVRKSTADSTGIDTPTM